MRALWREALELLDGDLRRRDAAPRTRRAYGVDLEQFAQLGRGARARAGRGGSARAAPLRGPPLAGRGGARRRRRASWRRCGRCIAASASTGGSRRARPTWSPRPRQPSRLPHVLKAAEVGTAAGEHPGCKRGRAAGAARPGAVRARVRVRAARARSWCRWGSATWTTTASSCGSRARGARRATCRSASRRWQRWRSTWSGAAQRSRRGLRPGATRAPTPAGPSRCCS